MQCYPTNLFRISLKFTDKRPFLPILSVSKTHFTDKQAFSSDLSVNFCPLWWRFTDKSRFSEHLSVKPGPKRLNFYGQTAVFAHFVRNRLFWSRTFTDRRPIFIDVSVILPNAAPDKSARQTISITEGDYHACAKIGSNLQSVANHPFFQFATEFFPAAFWSNCFLEMSEYQFIWMLLDKHNKNDSHH